MRNPEPMRSPIAYQVREYRGRTKAGVTEPLRGTLDAVFKRDGDEIRHLVYNELVAGQLALLIGLPVARGVLARGQEGSIYASLVLSQVGISLPEVTPGQMRKLVQNYGHECAGVVAFDMWIGNWDRSGGLHANLANPDVFRIFAARDHSHCLLNAKEPAHESLPALRSGVAFVPRHPLTAHVARVELRPWEERIAAVSKQAIVDACVYGHAIGTATPEQQKDVADALDGRRTQLAAILDLACPR